MELKALFFESETEKASQIGGNYPYNTLSFDEILVNNKVGQFLHLKKNDYVLVEFEETQLKKLFSEAIY